MDKKLELYRKVIEEERQYSEDISPILKELSRNVADLLEIAAQQGVEGTERKRLLDEDYAKISALTKSLHAKVKSVIVGQKSASEPPNEGIQGPTTPENAQKELIEVRKQMESSNKSFISMGCCITELLSVLTQEDSNTSRLIEGFEAQIRVYFKFVERTLISYFNSVHERENMPSNNYKFVCSATSVVGHIAAQESGRRIVMNHEKTHFLLKTFLNLLCRLRYPREIQLIGIFLKFLCDMSLEDAAVRIIQNHLTVMEQIVDYVSFLGKIDLQYMSIILLFNTIDDHLSSGQFERLSHKIDQISWEDLLNSPNQLIRAASKRLFQQIRRRQQSQISAE